MFTKEQKKEYYKKLREDWKVSKRMADADKKAEALFRESGLEGVSYYGFYFTLAQMRSLNLSGLPYIDCKTFGKWKEAGFKVKKGEHSKIRGITWLKVKIKINPKKKIEEDDDVYMYPKVYALFHRSQVEEM